MCRTRLPSPEPILHSHPEITFAVLVQTKDHGSKASILSVAVSDTILECAEPSTRGPKRASPSCSDLRDYLGCPRTNQGSRLQGFHPLRSSERYDSRMRRAFHSGTQTRQPKLFRSQRLPWLSSYKPRITAPRLPSSP